MTVQLYHGDCLEIMPTLLGIDAVVSDPPYGMNWDTDHTRFHVSAKGSGGQTKRSYAPVENDDKPFDPSPWLQFDKVVLWGSNHYAERLPVGTTLVWVKRYEKNFGSFLSDAEIGWMKGGHGVYCFRDLSLQGHRRLHATQKPVVLMKWCLEKAKIPIGATVLDPYMGSGTTGVACVQTGRNFIGIEKDETYFCIAQKRVNDAQAQGNLFAEVEP